MVEEFDLLEEVEVQFCDEECTESAWHSRYKWRHEFHSFFTSILVDNCTVIICNLGYCFA